MFRGRSYIYWALCLEGAANFQRASYVYRAVRGHAMFRGRSYFFRGPYVERAQLFLRGRAMFIGRLEGELCLEGAAIFLEGPMLRGRSYC